MKLLMLIFFIMSSFYVKGQKSFHFINPKKNSFKFELSGNLVIIPVKLNGVSLSFLLDTGVKETMLFISDTDSIPLENVHRVKFTGIGIEDGIEGIMALNNEFIVGGTIADFGHDIYVIDSKELDVSSHVGLPVHGILGSRFFENYIVQMDYLRNKIHLYDFGTDLQKKTRGFEAVPMSIERNRPYVQTKIKLSSNRIENAKMLLDMGNSDGMLIFPFLMENFTISEPSIYDYIGRGFNGEIYGRRNRIEEFDLAGFKIKEPIVSYPDSNAIRSAMLAENRKGSVGNQVLQHFHIFFDYQHSVCYLKPNKKFGKTFPINMAGIEVKHDGMIWSKSRVPTNLNIKDKEDNTPGIRVSMGESFRYEFKLLPIYIIANIREDSPAEKAGLLKGDELVRIDGRKAEFMKLQEIVGKFQEKNGKELRIVIKRNGELKSFEFLLKDPIPFRKT